MPLLAALLLAQRPAPVADLPFAHEPGRVWLKAHLNERAADAALDTGASATVADADAALAAGAKKEGPSYEVRSLGAAGSETWPAAGLNLRLDGLDANQSVAYAASLRRVATAGAGLRRLGALVGADLLRRYVVEIDYPTSHVRFYDPVTYSLPEGVKPLAARLVDGRPVVDLALRLPGEEERTLAVMIDTGSTGLTLTGAFARRERVLERHPEAKPYGGAGGIGGKATGRLVQGVVGYLGGEPFHGAAFVDETRGSSTGEAAAFDALVGDDVVGNRLVVLDYGRSRVYLGRTAR